jgi:two-component system NtrC family response regulator
LTRIRAVRSIRSSGAPALKGSPDPEARRWIGALIRVSGAHPAMTHILDVIERLQTRPFRTNFLIHGQPGTGKDGLARALHQLVAPGAALARLDVAGFPEAAALEALCGTRGRPGAAEEADGGTLLVEEVAALPPRVQLALLRLLKAGRCRRVGESKDVKKRLRVNAIALSDVDTKAAVADGRLRHDLYYRIARVVLYLPPLRERLGDLLPAAVWMGNRILDAAHVPLELRTADDLRHATAIERKRAIELDASAVEALRAHDWPGNLRELETVLERALMLYRKGLRLTGEDVRAALAAPT